jgi:hypothetical protein
MRKQPSTRSFRFIDMSGMTFGKWRVLEEVPRTRGTGAPKWKCVCECGTERSMTGNKLRRGASRSCGCARGENIKAAIASNPASRGSHGQYWTPTYRCWNSMMNRCHYCDENSVNYKRYKGAGISVCERWKKFENFFADMGERPSKEHSLDRYPNTKGNYEPGNVRWATREQQGNNKQTCTYLSLNGETLTVRQWARRIGITSQALHGRLKIGWPVDKALTNSKVGHCYKRGEHA